MASPRKLRCEIPRDAPAILRVWGVVTYHGPEERYEIEDGNYQVDLRSHDNVESIDLSQPHWFEGRAPIRQGCPDIAQAIRHTKARIDRLSPHDDCELIVRVVYCDVGEGCWEPVSFCLLNRTNKESAKEENGLREAEEDEDDPTWKSRVEEIIRMYHFGWSIPISDMVSAFASYLKHVRGQGAAEMPLLSTRRNRAVDSAPGGGPPAIRLSVLRGRQRRRSRRSTVLGLQSVSGPASGTAELPAGVEQEQPTKSEEWPAGGEKVQQEGEYPLREPVYVFH